MDQGAWHAAVHGSQRVRHDLVSKQQMVVLVSGLLHGDLTFVYIVE